MSSPLTDPYTLKVDVILFNVGNICIISTVFDVFHVFDEPFIWSNRLKRPNNSNNNSELYKCYNTALQRRGKHNIYSNINTRVQWANFDIFATLICITFIQYSKKGQIDLSLVSKHDVINKIDRRLTLLSSEVISFDIKFSCDNFRISSIFVSI